MVSAPPRPLLAPRQAIGRKRFRPLSAWAMFALLVALLMAALSGAAAAASSDLPTIATPTTLSAYGYDGVPHMSPRMHASSTLTLPAHVTTSRAVGGRAGATSAAASGFAAEDCLMAGSGPGRGVLEVSSQVRSTAAVRSFNPASAREFVFDPANERFVVGQSEKGFGHYGLAQEIGADENTVVGGMLSRGPNGEFFTDEMSGHYGINWTDEVRQQFVDFMRSYGFDIQHTMWGAGG